MVQKKRIGGEQISDLILVYHGFQAMRLRALGFLRRLCVLSAAKALKRRRVKGCNRVVLYEKTR
jgi:hypothetical protein